MHDDVWVNNSFKNCLEWRNSSASRLDTIVSRYLVFKSCLLGRLILITYYKQLDIIVLALDLSCWYLPNFIGWRNLLTEPFVFKHSYLSLLIAYKEVFMETILIFIWFHFHFPKHDESLLSDKGFLLTKKVSISSRFGRNTFTAAQGLDSTDSMVHRVKSDDEVRPTRPVHTYTGLCIDQFVVATQQLYVLWAYGLSIATSTLFKY